MKPEPLSPATLEQLRRLSTCIVASAIETFHVRLPNTGFADSSIRCVFEERPSMAGYAATVRIRSAQPPMERHGYYFDRTDWWDHVLSVPAPRVVVIEDLDKPPGLGAFIGEVNASILLALGCVGMVTNGAVRDLPDIRKTGLQLFAGNVSVSHAYAHVFEFGGIVEVGKLKVLPGDLIHADCHGVHTVPLEVAEKVPAVAHQILENRRRVIGLCQSGDLTIEKLRECFSTSKPETQT